MNYGGLGNWGIGESGLHEPGPLTPPHIRQISVDFSQCRQSTNKMLETPIWPVFYHTDPTDVHIAVKGVETPHDMV
jgi:hypothetical protein